MNEFNPKPYCEEAIKLASQFEKNFSYKPEDIADMDELLESVHETYENKKISDKTADIFATLFGVYLEQVMLDNSLAEYGYKWVMDDSEPCLVKDDGNKMYPLTKVSKMIENGVEDSVKSFYDVGIAIASGKFKL